MKTYALLAMCILSAAPALADAGPNPSSVGDYTDEMKRYLDGVWAYRPAQFGTGDLTVPVCGTADPNYLPAPGFETYGPYAVKFSFSAFYHGVTVTEQRHDGEIPSGVPDKVTQLTSYEYQSSIAADAIQPYRRAVGGELPVEAWGRTIAIENEVLLEIDADTLLSLTDQSGFLGGGRVLKRCA